MKKLLEPGSPLTPQNYLRLTYWDNRTSDDLRPEVAERRDGFEDGHLLERARAAVGATADESRTSDSMAEQTHTDAVLGGPAEAAINARSWSGTPSRAFSSYNS